MPEFDRKILMDTLVRGLARDPSGRGRATIPVAWVSTTGSIRTENQDRVLVGLCLGGLVVAILADGMGGMKGGARAAAIAASAIGAHCASASDRTGLPQLLDAAFRYANDEVFAVFRGEGGAAVVVAAARPTACFVAHAGDARAYLATDDNGLTQITVDDTVKAQLENMGRPSDPDARLHSQLLQFVGVGQGLRPHVASVPDGGRGLILASDGVHSLPSAVMQWIARGSSQLVSLAERLVTASEWHGGKDNATVIALGFPNESAGPAEPRTVVAEFWLPGDHVLVVPSSARWTQPHRRYGPGPEVQGPQPGIRSKTKKSKKTQARRGTATADTEPSRRSERQLPVMTSEEEAPITSPETEGRAVPGGEDPSGGARNPNGAGGGDS